MQLICSQTQEEAAFFSALSKSLITNHLILSEEDIEHLTMVTVLSPFPAILMLFLQWTTILHFCIFFHLSVYLQRDLRKNMMWQLRAHES